MEGRFCSLEQMHSAMRKTLVEPVQLRPRNCVTTKKRRKRSSPKKLVFFPKIKRRQKKRFSTRFEIIFGLKLRNLLVLLHLIVHCSNLDGGTPKSPWGHRRSPGISRTSGSLASLFSHVSRDNSGATQRS